MSARFDNICRVLPADTLARRLDALDRDRFATNDRVRSVEEPDVA